MMDTIRIYPRDGRRISRLRESGHVAYRCTKCFKTSVKKSEKQKVEKTGS